MSEPHWENLPEAVAGSHLEPHPSSPRGFQADPRAVTNQGLRASDADRSVAAGLLDQALADGRLAPAEHAGRKDQVYRSRTLGDLAPLVADLMLPPDQPPDATLASRLRRAGVLGWVGLAIVFNLIWVMTSLTAGRLLYYWPMWPMFGIGIPVVLTLISRGSRDQPSSGPGDVPELPPASDLR